MWSPPTNAVNRHGSTRGTSSPPAPPYFPLAVRCRWAYYIRDLTLFLWALAVACQNLAEHKGWKSGLLAAIGARQRTTVGRGRHGRRCGPTWLADWRSWLSWLCAPGLRAALLAAEREKAPAWWWDSCGGCGRAPAWWRDSYRGCGRAWRPAAVPSRDGPQAPLPDAHILTSTYALYVYICMSL